MGFLASHLAASPLGFIASTTDGDRDMRGLISLVLFCFAASCYAKSVDELKTDAEQAVKDKLSQEYKPGECERWLTMSAGGSVSKDDAIAVCDSNFNPNNGFTFSEIKLYQHDGFGAVCGIVSGKTDISRIGGRFVYRDGKYQHVFIKNSKYPMYLKDKSTISRNMLTIYANQLKNESDYCK